MSQTPFTTEEDSVFLKPGYVHTNPVTGKRYVLRKSFASYPYDNEEHNIWLPLGDVTNRTFVGPSDPTSEVNPPNPHNGDLWWDNHQLELRVWHQPKIGNASSGETIPGTGTWISSTHPMADMVTLDGNDKNHTFGKPIIFGEYGDKVYETKIVDFEIAMPTYTGPDGPPKDPKNPPQDYLDNPDARRFTYEWSVIPQYNAPSDFLDPLDEEGKKVYENTIIPVGRDDGIAETSDHYRVRVKTGKFGGTTTTAANPYQRSINVVCKLTVKSDSNDLFLPMKVDGELVLHNLSVKTPPVMVISQRVSDGIVQFVPKSKTIADIFADSKIPAPSTYKGSIYDNPADDGNVLVDMFDIIDYVKTAPNPEDQAEDLPEWSIERSSETGSFYIVETPDEVNQVPHLVIDYELASISELTLYFSYGKDGEVYENHVVQDGFDPKADSSNFNGMTSNVMAQQYGIKFFKEGFTTRDLEEMPSGQDLIDLYKHPIDGPIEIHNDKGEDYVTRKLVIKPSSEDDGTPNRIYFIGYDFDNNIYLPSFHGELKMFGTSRLEEQN